MNHTTFLPRLRRLLRFSLPAARPLPEIRFRRHGMLRPLFFCWLALASALASISTSHAKGTESEFTQWHNLLQKHVHWLPDQVQSRVNYAGFKQDKAQLAQVLAGMSRISQSEFDGWSSNEQTAFLINAYNAFTIELILSKYPDLKSIKDLGSVFSSPWKKEFFQLLGEKRNLDWIEHKNLRLRRDPRFHVAIVCASIGCPALRPEAWRASNLETLLDDSMQRFLGDKTRNRVVADPAAPAGARLEVSLIFKWFAEDFEKGDKGFRSTQDVFARYASQFSPDPAMQEKIRSKRLPVSFGEYDWALNDGKPAGR